ncbi:hypothetical protein [Streptomyces sp. NEAU-L66]
MPQTQGWPGWLAMALPRSGERGQRYRREENEAQHYDGRRLGGGASQDAG